MFWAWLLKYSSFLITGAVSFVVSYVIYRLTNRFSYLIFYTSHHSGSRFLRRLSNQLWVRSELSRSFCGIRARHQPGKFTLDTSFFLATMSSQIYQGKSCKRLAVAGR